MDFKTDFPDLKWTTVNDWKDAIERKMKEEMLKGTVVQLEGKKKKEEGHLWLMKL